MENFFSQIENIVLRLKINKIVILGKGSSAAYANQDVLKDSLVININDSERIYPGTFAVFHSEWVKDSIIENGFKAQWYISNLNLDIYNIIQVPYMPDDYDSDEKLSASLLNKEFVLSDFLLLAAIRLAIIIANFKREILDVYLIGFDFKISNSTIIDDYSGHEFDFKEVFLKIQHDYFKRLKFYIESGDFSVKIKHVGDLDFSDLSIENFNSLIVKNKPHYKKKEFDFQREYKELLKKAKTGKTLIVAEFTNNHIGDVNRLIKMIQLAKESGADMIKVQKRDIETFYTKEQLNSPYSSPFGNTLEDYRKAVELTSDHFKILNQECAKNEIFWFSTILDYPSLKFISKFTPPLIKIPSTISNHKNFLNKVNNEFLGDLVISTGFTDLNYEKFLLNNFFKKRNVFLLQATSSYPAPPEACQISVVRHYDYLNKINYPNLIPGYSSHDIGSLGCMMAVAAGARMIEKHVKLGNLSWVHFDGVAIDLLNGDFKRFVKDVRNAETMCSSEIKEIHKQEHHKYYPNDRCN